jgi:hypothetical protein
MQQFRSDHKVISQLLRSDYSATARRRNRGELLIYYEAITQGLRIGFKAI